MSEKPKDIPELIIWLDENFGDGRGHPVAMTWEGILDQIERAGFRLVAPPEGEAQG